MADLGKRGGGQDHILLLLLMGVVLVMDTLIF